MGRAAAKKAVRRKKVAPASIGLKPSETRDADDPALLALTSQIERDGGAVLGRYRDPFGGTPLALAALPIDRVEPTPYQRDPSDAHVKRLMGVIETIGRFLDPIIAIREDGQYLDAQRQPSAAGAAQARRAKRSSRSSSPTPTGRVQDPRAQHREGPQPPREVARDDPHGARAREDHRPTRRPPSLRVRTAGLSHAGHLLRRAAAAERRRVPVDPPPGRRVPRRADRQGAQGARAPRPEDPQAR